MGTGKILKAAYSTAVVLIIAIIHPYHLNCQRSVHNIQLEHIKYKRGELLMFGHGTQGDEKKLLENRADAKLEPLFFARSPATIKYAKQPLPVNKAYTEISTEIFAKEQKIHWTDGMVGSPDKRDVLWEDTRFPKLSISQIEQRLHNPLQSLVVCEMDPRVQKGLYLDVDGPEIRCGEIITIYAGELNDYFESLKSSMYRMALDAKEHESSPFKKFNIRSTVCAESFGNIIRYAQDLPDGITELASAQVISEDALAADKILTANAIVVPYIYKGCPIAVLIALRDIKPGEQIGFSYEGNYQHGEKRYVFNTQGKIIGHFVGQDKIVINSLASKNSEKAPRADLKHMQLILKPIILSPAIDTFDHEEQFVGNILYILDIYKNRYHDNTVAMEYINFLKKCVAEATTAAEIHQALDLAFKKAAFFPAIKILQTMQNELTNCMKHYIHRAAQQQKLDAVKPEIGKVTKQLLSLLFNPYSCLPRKKLGRETQDQADKILWSFTRGSAN